MDGIMISDELLFPNAGAYSYPTDEKLKELFNSDDGEFLKQPQQLRLYNKFSGNETLKTRKPIENSKVYERPIHHISNTMVYTDFPKGASHSDTTYMWNDGTYEETLKRIHKVNEEAPPIFALKESHRQEQYDLQKISGGHAVLDTIREYEMGIQTDKDELMRNYLRSKGLKEDQIDQIVAEAHVEQATKDAEKTFSNIGITKSDVLRDRIRAGFASLRPDPVDFGGVEETLHTAEGRVEGHSRKNLPPANGAGFSNGYDTGAGVSQPIETPPPLENILEPIARGRGRPSKSYLEINVDGPNFRKKNKADIAAIARQHGLTVGYDTTLTKTELIDMIKARRAELKA
jgi:hypothetical protein